MRWSLRCLLLADFRGAHVRIRSDKLHDMSKKKQVQDLKVRALSFGQAVDVFVTEVLSAQQAGQTENHRIAIFACAVRMLRTYQAVHALVDRDLNDGAAAVLRSLLEQNYVFTALCKDESKLLDAVREVSGEGRKALNGLLKVRLESRPLELTDAVLVKAIGEHPNTSGFQVHSWAQAAGLEDTYHTIYRTLSTFAHGSIGAIEKYLDMDQDGVIHGIRSRVAATNAIEFVLIAGGLILEAARAVDNRPGIEVQRARIGYLSSLHSELYENYWALPEG